MNIAVMLIPVFIIISFALTLGEMSMIAISDQKVNDDSEAGHKKAKRIQIFTKDTKKHILSVHSMITLFAILNGAIALDLFKDNVLSLFEKQNVWVEVLVYVFIAFFLLVLHIVFIERIARKLGIKHADFLAYKLVSFVFAMHAIFKPVNYTLLFISNMVGHLFGLNPNEADRNMTEEEIRTIVEASSLTGIIDQDEREMIHNIFEFNDTNVSEIMTHRTEISALSIKASRDEIVKFVNSEKYTRFPVYEDNLDSIIGTLHVKDLLKYLDSQDEEIDLKNLLRKPYFVPDSKRTSDLFKDMQKQKNHIAIVIDEYGGTAGIVTIEDLIEEIVGNIFDEYDDIELEIVKISDHVYEIDGLANIDDIEDQIKGNLPVEDYDTLSGFILGYLGRIPNIDEQIIFDYDGYRYEVLQVEEQVITKVRVTKISQTIINDEES
jgi:putative hemolysin